MISAPAPVDIKAMERFSETKKATKMKVIVNRKFRRDEKVSEFFFTPSYSYKRCASAKETIVVKNDKKYSG